MCEARDKSDTYNYMHSCDLKSHVMVKIGTLEGKREKPSYKELLDNPVLKYSGRNENFSDIIAECRIYGGYGDGRYLTLPICTTYKPFTTRWDWNEWLELPIQYCDLPKNSVLLITIYDYESPRKKVPIGGTTMLLFDHDGVYVKGIVDLRVWPGVEADRVNTPGGGSIANGGSDEVHRLNKLVKKYENGQINRVDWLDRLVFAEIEVIKDQEKKTSNFMYLTLEFPKMDIKGVIYELIWWENKSEPPEQCALNKYYKNMVLHDPELGLENLYEKKHHYLTRSLQSGIIDKDLKPNSTNRDMLLNIIQYPPTRQLTSDEQDLIWKYRYFLSNHKKGLTKFLKCVNWSLGKEGEQALSLLREWSPLDAQDALELLGPNFTHPEIRKYAVERLDGADDEELLLYLLQLVQALKYEAWEIKSLNLLDVSHYSLESDVGGDSYNLASPLSTKSLPKPCDTSEKSKICTNKGEGSSQPTLDNRTKSNSQKQEDLISEESVFKNSKDLSSFLIKRSCENSVLASYFYWYLLIECEDKSADQVLKPESKVREMYLWVMTSFKIALQRNAKSKQTLQTLLRQQQLVDALSSIMQTVGKETSGRLKKIEKLLSLLEDPVFNLNNFDVLPLPLNPEVSVCGIVGDKATLFKSALEPCKLTFKTVDSNNEEYIAIFKCGDDLRQDQLIIQIITLMNKLLLNENMDLKLTPYKVLATSSRHGFVQYIDSISIAEVLRTDGTIQNFFRLHAPCEKSPYGISPQVMDTYLRSCAGYCVITYILGIGDRHFDNLLLTRQGHLFHIDFGYILGRDPKPLPPPMKLTKEMVEAMGGQNSEHYTEFRRLCYTTFVQLRRHSSLVLNLFSLMVDASVPDIALEPDKTTKKVEDRFCLVLNEEEAVAHVQEVIDASVGAVVAAVVEQFHRFAQYIRK